MSPVGVAGKDAARPLGLLVGRTLSEVELGHTIVLRLSGGWQVLIENTVHVSGPAGRSRVQPGETSADVLAVLVGDVVRTARSGDDGDLRLGFGGGTELSVGIDADDESWAVTGPDAFLLICLARGELAAWGGAGRR